MREINTTEQRYYFETPEGNINGNYISQMFIQTQKRKRREETLYTVMIIFCVNKRESSDEVWVQMSAINNYLKAFKTDRMYDLHHIHPSYSKEEADNLIKDFTEFMEIVSLEELLLIKNRAKD